MRFPYNDELVAQVCQASESDLEDAIVSAERVFETTRKLSSHARSEILYGGVKGSGIGKEGPRYAIEEMTEMRIMAVNPDGGHE